MKKTVPVIACLLLSLVGLIAGAPHKSDLARRVGGTNEGTEFYLTFHPAALNLTNNAKVRIFFASSTNADINLEIPGLHITRSIKVSAMSVTECDLEPAEAMVYTMPGQALIKPFPADVWTGGAVHIVSDNPVTCFAIFDGDATSEGYMAIPVKNWGKEYVVSTFNDAFGSTQLYQPCFASIIAAEDNTTIEFKCGGNPSTTIPIPGGKEINAGKTYTKTINRGDVLLIPGKNLNNDLSGSTVKANKPVGVFSGNFNAYIPNDITPPNYTIEMEQPVYSWGRECMTPTIISRTKSPLVRIYSNDSANNLFKDGSKFWTFNYINGFMDSSWIEQRTDPDKSKSVDFSSDSAINIVLYNPGFTEDSVESAPFQLNLLPLSQYQDNFYFVVPNTSKNTPFQHTYLNLIFKTKDTAKIPDDLKLNWDDGLGFKWQSLNTFIHDTVKLIKQDTSGLYWMSVNVQLPGNSFYGISADYSFAAYCYGFSDTKSFAYPAAGLYSLPQDLDSLPPNISLSRDSISDNVNIIAQDTSQTDFDLAGICQFYLDPSDSYNVEIQISPSDSGKIMIKAMLGFIDRSHDARAHLVAIDCNGNRKDTILEFTDLKRYPEFSPVNYNLGLFQLKTGNYNVDTVTVINPSTVQNSIQIDSIVSMNSSSPFIYYSDFLKGRKLLPGENIKISLTVKTVNSGIFKDTLKIYCLSYPVSFAFISATVTEPKIDVTPKVAFDGVLIDSMSDSKHFAVRNPGELPLVLQGVEYPSNKTFFADYIDFSGGMTYTIAPGDSIEYLVRFKPLQEGLSTDSLTFFSDGSGNNVVHFSGIGITSGVFESSLKDDIQLIESGNEISFKTGEPIYTNSIELYDYRGLKLLNIKTDNYLNNILINTQNYPSGFYIIKINSERKNYIKTLIKIN